MKTLSNSELITVWERGVCDHPLDRALILLSAYSCESADALARLDIASRDTRLIEMYTHLFGPDLHAFGHCPACKQPLEYTLSANKLLESVPAPNPEAFAVKSDSFSMQLRLPDTLDLRALAGCSDHESALKLLSERCVVEAMLDGAPVEPGTLSPQMIETVSSALEAANSRAEILLNLNCSACHHAWQVTLDIERFLWARLASTAKHLLHEVHTLASAYGWRESDILSLSTARRQAYVEMTCPTF